MNDSKPASISQRFVAGLRLLLIPWTLGVILIELLLVLWHQRLSMLRSLEYVVPLVGFQVCSGAILAHLCWRGAGSSQFRKALGWAALVILAPVLAVIADWQLADEPGRRVVDVLVDPGFWLVSWPLVVCGLATTCLVGLLYRWPKPLSRGQAPPAEPGA